MRYAIPIVSSLIALGVGLMLGRFGAVDDDGGLKERVVGAEKRAGELRDRLERHAPARSEPVETTFEEWFYPGARGMETMRFLDEGIKPRGGPRFEWRLGFTEAMSTTDDFETVVRHYGRLMNAKQRRRPPESPDVQDGVGTIAPDGWSEREFGHRHHSSANGVVVVVDAAGSADPEDDYARRRPFDVATLSLQAPNANVTVAVSRGPDEKRTYVFVIFNEWPANGAHP